MLNKIQIDKLNNIKSYMEDLRCYIDGMIIKRNNRKVLKENMRDSSNIIKHIDEVFRETFYNTDLRIYI